MSDYFGGTSRSLKLGSGTDKEGVIQRSVGENADIYFVYMLIFCENMV